MEALSVTALCLTRNRRRWLPRAIQCFQDQTYSNKRLLILADGEDVWDLIPTWDTRITLCTLPEDNRPRTIGEKRNLGCSLATTDIVALFDDDDWSCADRIEDQVDRLEATRVAVTGYRHMFFHASEGEENWWRYDGVPMHVLGTSLCFKRSWWTDHPFPPMHTSEDTTFSSLAAFMGPGLVKVDIADPMVVGNLAIADGLGMQVASIHPGNTSPRDLSPQAHNYVRLPSAPALLGYTR